MQPRHVILNYRYLLQRKVFSPHVIAPILLQKPSVRNLSLSTAGFERLPIPIRLEDQFWIIPFQQREIYHRTYIESI